MVPVADRVIRAKGDSLLAARVGQLPDHVAAERRVHDVVVGRLVSNMQKPSWCLVVNTMYFIPACLASDPLPASNCVGLNCL